MRAFLVPLGLWGLYTYVENNSIKKLDEKFGLNLRPARLSALTGALVSGIAYTYGLYAEIPSLFPYPANAFRLSVFGTPFLIISCLLLIRGLNRAHCPQTDLRLSVNYSDFVRKHFERLLDIFA